MRLVVVSNRLPVTAVEENRTLRFQKSAGGLVSGLSAYLDSMKQESAPIVDTEYLWVGWPGMTIADREKEKLKTDLLSRLQAYPVFMSERDMGAFYLGFCNRAIWPLFHYFPERVVVDHDYWKSYVRVNETFRNAVLEIIRPGDVLWIHDYHLLLLPKLLRESLPDIPIGFFLHIPFPSFEMFRLLPRKWSREILEGLLGANLIGFHTYDYTQHFLGCVLRMLGYEHNMGKLLLDNRIVKAGTFPMGIDFREYYNTALGQEVEKETRRVRKTLGDCKVIISIDRLDYTKGVVHRLRGYEAFLRTNPQWHGKVVLALVVVPSRIGVEHYQQMKRQIDELVGRINGEFANLHWSPIVYQYNFLPKVPLVSLYRAGDVALVTPLRDGMNLIAKEYVASRTDQGGVLVLSDMAGASKELGEAIMVNPVNAEEIVDALKEALDMAPEDQTRRMTAMQNRLRRYDVARWAHDFMQELLAVQSEQQQWDTKSRDPLVKEALLRRCRNSQRRLFFLDYDGTLVQFEDDPQAASPGKSLLSILQRLSQDPRNQVVLISGRERVTLQKWFATVPMALVAEHGVWIKEKSDSEWNMIKTVTIDWKPRIFPILERYVDRLPGSWIEEKDFSLVWHYRKADREQGSIVARELSDELVALMAAVDVHVLHGAKIVEIRQDSVNKGTAGQYFVERTEPDFILAIGDDWTDEDLFRALPESACTIKVGMAQSRAQYNVANHSEVVNLLEALAV
jgi:trehalose 6-phosphate synthase/phosphatase